MQTCVQSEAVCLLYSFMHSSLSPVSKYRERYEQNGLQATTTTVGGGRPPQDNNIIHTEHDVQTCVQSEAVCLLYSFMHSSLLSPVSKYRERYGLNGLH